jgi:hypothetical protein
METTAMSTSTQKLFEALEGARSAISESQGFLYQTAEDGNVIHPALAAALRGSLLGIIREAELAVLEIEQQQPSLVRTKLHERPRAGNAVPAPC